MLGNPKRRRRAAEAHDENVAAKAALDRILARHEAQEAPPKPKDEYMAEMGRNGGKIGGKRSLVTMTEGQRMVSAQRAAAARWERKLN